MHRSYLKFLFIFIFSTCVMPLDIEIKVGKSLSKKYSVYHIRDSQPFKCKSKSDINDNIKEYICKINSRPNLLNFKKEKYTLANIWFNISKDNLFLHIQPLKKSIIYPVYQPLHSTSTISNNDKNPSKVWSIYMFENNNTIFQQKDDEKGLDFDITLAGNARPFIGSLDVDKKPLVSKMNNEVKTLVELEELVRDERYRTVINTANKLKRLYPNSTFSDEIGLYRLRGLDGVDIERNAFIILEESEKWLKDNPSHKDIPEVLYYMARAQAKISRHDLAEISYKKIVTQHPTHRFALLSKIYLGEILEEDSDIFASIKLYKEALYETDDLDVALLAARKIADKSLSDSIYTEAKSHYEKILDKKEDYILEDVDSAYQLVRNLRVAGIKSTAGRIVESLSQRIDRDAFPEKHEDYIFEAAQLYSDNDFNKSIYYFQEYIKLYPEGVNIKAARRELDLLLLEKDKEKTPMAQLEYLNYIMEAYPDTEIARIALYRKAKILFGEKKYDFLLKNETKLRALDVNIAPDIEELILESARLFVVQGLKNDFCEVVVNTITKYDLTLEREHHIPLFNCYKSQFIHEKAHALAQENIDKGGENQLFWLAALEKLLFSQQKYAEVIKISKEVLDMSKISDSNISYDDTWYDVFDSYLFLDKTAELLKAEKEITRLFPEDLRTASVYKSIAKMAKKNKDDFMTIDMANKIFKIQDIFKSYDDSPWIDYSYAESLVNVSKFKAALSSLHRLEGLVMEKKVKADVAKISYTKSTIYQNLKLRDQQEIELTRCAETNSSKVWSRICRNTLKWL